MRVSPFGCGVAVRVVPGGLSYNWIRSAPGAADGDPDHKKRKNDPFVANSRSTNEEILKEIDAIQYKRVFLSPDLKTGYSSF